jgi:hypothetical protein
MLTPRPRTERTPPQATEEHHEDREGKREPQILRAFSSLWRRLGWVVEGEGHET